MISCDAHLLQKTCDAHLMKIAPVKTRVGTYVAKHSPKLAAALRRTLQAQAKKAAASIRRFKKVDLTDEQQQIIDDLLEQIAIDGVGVAMVDDLSDTLVQAFKDAGVYGVSQVGINDGSDKAASIVEQLDEKALKYAQERGAELITDFADTTREDLQAVLAQGVADGLSTNALADAIEESGAFGEARAEMIARTELAFAHVEGNVEGWRQSGEVTGKRSILGDLHAIDDECDDCAAAGVVDLEDDFVPGYDFPPYHPNCICDVVPVLSGEEE